MSLAWQVMEEDIQCVIKRFENVDESEVEKIFCNLDHHEVEEAVLSYDTFDDQVEASFDEIERQMRELMGLT